MPPVMNENQHRSIMRTITLTKHKLPHIPALQIDPGIFRPTYDGACSMGHCNAHCCRDGVFLDPMDKQKILDHADLVISHMDPHQIKDPGAWFEEELRDDPDFPSGVCAGTAALSNGCVFLNARGHCVLQVAATAAGMEKFALKPYFCVAFPLTISEGVLTVEDGSFTNRSQCCAPGGDPQLAPADVCREELEFMLGAEGLEECDEVRTSLSM